MNTIQTAVLAALGAFIFAPALAAEDSKDAAVVIHIDKKMRYIKEGDTEQKPVTVTVGQAVVWKNLDESAAHTATSRLKGMDGKPLFDTGKIEGGKSAKVVLDIKIYEAAGGKGGAKVELEYHCTLHPRGKSKLLLVPA